MTLADLPPSPVAPPASSPAPRRGKTQALTPGYRLEVASRSLLAVVGGFALASGAAVLIMAVLTATGAQPRGFATSSGTYLSWIFWVCAAMWAFYARTQRLAWASTLAITGLLWGLASLIRLGG